MVGGRGNDTCSATAAPTCCSAARATTCSPSRDATFRRVDGGTGNDVLAFAGAITLADTDFRTVDDVESLRLGNGTSDDATILILGPIADLAIDGLPSIGSRLRSTGR